VSKHKFVVCVLTAGTLVLLAGCSHSKQREAGQNLLDEAGRAGKLYSRALSLMANPVYQIGQAYPPLRSEIRPAEGEILVPPAFEIHPEVLPILKKIEDSLTAALSANQEHAGASEKAVVQMMLARASSLRGHCHALELSLADTELANLRSQAEGNLAKISLSLDLLEHYNAVAAVNDQETRNLRAQGVADQSLVQDEIKEIDARLAAIDEERTAQSRKYEQRNAEARAMSIEARIGPVKEGLAKLEAALEIQAQASKAEARVAELEHEAHLLARKRQVLELDLQAAAAQVKAGESELARGEARRAESMAAAQEIAGQLHAALTQLQELLTEMERFSLRLANALGGATKAYDAALSYMGRAQGEPISGVPSREARVLITVADLQQRVLQALESNKRFVEDLVKIWARASAGSLPPAAMKLGSFVADAGSLQSDAESRCTKAISLYEKSLRSADRRYRWAYQGELAAGYVKLYKLTKDPETLGFARDALDEALKDKRFSPNLISIAELQDIYAESERVGPPSP